MAAELAIPTLSGQSSGCYPSSHTGSPEGGEEARAGLAPHHPRHQPRYCLWLQLEPVASQHFRSVLIALLIQLRCPRRLKPAEARLAAVPGSSAPAALPAAGRAAAGPAGGTGTPVRGLRRRPAQLQGAGSPGEGQRRRWPGRTLSVWKLTAAPYRQ